MTYLDSLRNALHRILELNPKALVLGEDILDPYGGAFKVTQGLSTRFPDRVFTTPICEASIVGMAVGLALRGMAPIAEIMFGDFLTLAVDQLVNHAAKYPAMYNGQVSASMVVRTPMGGGRGYGPTHSQSLERLFFGIPHLKLIAPSHAHDPGALLEQAVSDHEPILFVENKLLYPLHLLDGHDGDTGSSSENRLQREETDDTFGYPVVALTNYNSAQIPDITIIAYGGLSRVLAAVLERMAAEEMWIKVCLPACISPLDHTPLLASAAESGRVIVVEESPVAFGWGAEVAARLHEHLGNRLLAPISRIGTAPTVIPAAKALENRVLIDEDAIERTILQLLGLGGVQ